MTDVSWTYITRTKDVLEVFCTSYVHSIYVLCPGGNEQIAKSLMNVCNRRLNLWFPRKIDLIHIVCFARNSDFYLTFFFFFFLSVINTFKLMLQCRNKYFTLSTHGIHCKLYSWQYRSAAWGMKNFFIFIMSLFGLKMYIENYSSIS